jgi:small ligand-binding sensory domain FIST
MSVAAQSFVTSSANSLATGRDTAHRVLDGLGGEPKLVLTYLSVNHDQGAFLRGLHEVVGPNVPVLGCSAQGVIGRGLVREEGYAAGALALRGDSLCVAHGAVENIAADAFESGSELGRKLCAGLATPPKVAVIHYDALSRIDPDRFLAGLFRELECPILGGASAHSFNYQSLHKTFQYEGERVMTGGAIGFAIGGDCGVEFEGSHGCSPVGVELVVTRAEGNVLHELDGKRAFDVWAEICGDIDPHSNQSSALAIGVRRGPGPNDYLVRAAYALDPTTGHVHLGPAIAEGTRIMLHHRTVEDVAGGARVMGQNLRARLAGKRTRAILGFECGARTRPFLGDRGTLEENLSLQAEVSEGAAWLGMIPWGEFVPVAGRPEFHNYAYALLALTD